MSVCRRIKTIIRIITLILNPIITTPQLLSKSYYWLSTMPSHLMLLLQGLLVSKFQGMGMGFGDIVISSLSLLLQIRDALRMRMSSLKGRSRAAEVSLHFQSQYLMVSVLSRVTKRQKL